MSNTGYFSEFLLCDGIKKIQGYSYSRFRSVYYRNTAAANTPSKRDMVCFLTLILKLIKFINTLPIKKNITGRTPSRKNIGIFSKNSKSNTKKNFCLSGWVKSITPAGFPSIWFSLGLYYFYPFGIEEWTKNCSGFPKDDLLQCHMLFRNLRIANILSGRSFKEK